MILKYYERPEKLVWQLDPNQWVRPRIFKDENGKIYSCWPVANETQMWREAHCRGCYRSVYWAGLGTPCGDDEHYFMENETWCFWCFPLEKLTEDMLPLVVGADWGRRRTVSEILALVEEADALAGDKPANEGLSRLAREIEKLSRDWRTEFCGTPHVMPIEDHDSDGSLRAYWEKHNQKVPK